MRASRRLSATVLVCSLSAGLALAAAPAAADERDPILDALVGVTESGRDMESPNLQVLDGLAASTGSGAVGEAARVEHEDVTIVVPDNPADGIVVSSDAGAVTIGLPFASEASDAVQVTDAVVAYDNGNGTTTAPALKEDGSVQITTVIEDEHAPTAYEYQLDIPTGATAELVDGTVAIRGADGALIAGIAPAWATDASGAAVPTHYVLEGAALTQVIEHSPEHQYPVVGDPWMGKALLSSAWVTYHTGYYRVNAEATSWGRSNFGLAVHADHVAELKTKLGSHSWRVDANSGTIRDQFLCHVWGNAFEPGTYNLESNRQAQHWLTQFNLVDRCNPLIVTTNT